MKRFLVISLLASLMCGRAVACAWEGPSHNSYMFSVFPREMMYGTEFGKHLSDFWSSFTGEKVTDYYWERANIREAVEQRGDRELLGYMDQLDAYLDISQQLRETWTYPTKQELQERRARLESMLVAADNYRGQRLRPQYQLLRMRANMLLGRHQANVTFYEQTAQKLPASAYRDMMRNIYAGALLHTGNMRRACDIYAAQGDMVSIKWCVRKHRNLAGIQSLYKENPNSPTLLYLVQDFVNNAQETLDGSDEEWMQLIDVAPVYKAEVMQFIDFANRVAAEGKSQSPALWKAAAGALHYLFGNAALAADELSEAMTLGGTQRMKDNARAIRLIACAAADPMGSQYGSFVAGELQWLDQKIAEERNGRKAYDNHYTDIKDRLCHQVLYPRFKKAGQLSKGMAALAMMSEDDLDFNIYNFRSKAAKNEEYSFNGDYGNEFFEHLGELTVQELEDYYRYVKGSHTDALERYLVSRAYRDDNYFCDLIGTRYIARGQFDKALTWLERVDLGFLSGQNISSYMLRRDYGLPKWTADQRGDEAEDGPGKGTFNINPKMAYCRTMMELEAKYQMANQQIKPDYAYELAMRYYQASHLGDCWFLTHYGWSCADTVRTGEKDFVATAIDYLQVAKRSDNPELKQEALYALAYIPVEPWADYDYDWSLNKLIITPHPQSRQYRALQELGRFAATHPAQLKPYISRCDVLKRFR